MKKDQYFNLEVNLLNEDNIAVMMSELNAAEAVGMYVMLLLHLRTKDHYEASCHPSFLKAFAKRYEVDLEKMERVIREFALFEVDEERQMFRSPYLDRVMTRLEERWKVNAENGKKGGRPKKAVKGAETPSAKGQEPNETQEKRGEEKKGEENKGIATVASNSSNTDNVATEVAVADRGMRICAVDEEGQRPLQPVESWEKLVDKLDASESYMELAGQRSGLGQLFIDHRQLILKLFKEHILLYGKSSELLFPEDVKRYFSNFIAAGSTSCRILREALLAEINKESREDSARFETRSNGQRTYLGHLIPDDAPPRPDASAVWDDVKKKWGN